MNIFKEKLVFSRRQFVKGSGMLVASALVAGIFTKIGFGASTLSDEYVKQRGAGLYANDASMPIRKSHENPEIAQIYKEYLSPGSVSPLSEKAHHLLHTKYGKDIPGFIDTLKNEAAAA